MIWFISARLRVRGLNTRRTGTLKRFSIPCAHAANDRAVLAAYGLVPDTPDPEIVAHLF